MLEIGQILALILLAQDCIYRYYKLLTLPRDFHAISPSSLIPYTV
jgi:hypothetical protein